MEMKNLKDAILEKLDINNVKLRPDFKDIVIDTDKSIFTEEDVKRGLKMLDDKAMKLMKYVKCIIINQSTERYTNNEETEISLCNKECDAYTVLRFTYSEDGELIETWPKLKKSDIEKHSLDEDFPSLLKYLIEKYVDFEKL